MDGQRAAATLGVDRRATRDEIRRAFRARAKLLHPDTGPTGSMERFIALRRAFERLMAEAPIAPPASPPGPSPARAGGRSGPFETAGRDHPVARSTIDLTDSSRRPGRGTPPAASPGREPVRRDARGLSFADHLSAALARP